MRTNARLPRRWAVPGLALSTGLLVGVLISGTAVAAEQMKELLVRVTNTPEDPVPVTLEGEGSVSGSVEVTNTPLPVEVEGTPTVNAEQSGDWTVNVEGGGPAPATASFNQRWEFGGLQNAELPTPLYASLIAISPENDDLRVFLIFDDETWVSLGALNQQFPPVTVLTPAQPIPVDRVQLQCWNTIEDCEVALSIVGTPIGD